MICTKPNSSNKGRESHCVEVKLEGVPATGLIGTGSDITIVRADLFYHIVEKTGLDASQLKQPDHKTCTYDQTPITLDGQMDMTLSFGKEELQATVYVKLVTPDKLLLSEAVCRQLGIVNYHPSVKAVPRCTAEAVFSLTNVVSDDKKPNATQALTIHDTAVSEPEVKTTEGKRQTGENSKRPGIKFVGNVPAKFSARPLAKRSLGKQSKPGRPPVLRDPPRDSGGNKLGSNEDQDTYNAQHNFISTRKKQKPRRSKTATSKTTSVHCPYSLKSRQPKREKIHYARDELN